VGAALAVAAGLHCGEKKVEWQDDTILTAPAVAAGLHCGGTHVFGNQREILSAPGCRGRAPLRHRVWVATALLVHAWRPAVTAGFHCGLVIGDSISEGFATAPGRHAGFHCGIPYSIEIGGDYPGCARPSRPDSIEALPTSVRP
jgi:hypothetical protein